MKPVTADHPPLVYPLAEAERELRRLRTAIARITRRLEAVERALARHLELAMAETPAGAGEEARK